MRLPPAPPLLDFDPAAKPAVPDHLLQNVRAEAAEAQRSCHTTHQIQQVIERMRGRVQLPGRHGG